MSYSNRLKSIYKLVGLAAVFMSGLGICGVVNAGDRDRWHDYDRNDECPVGVLPGAPGQPSTTLDLEFGAGTSDLTTCLSNRENVKIVMQINQSCRDSFVNTDGKVINNVATCPAGRAFALGNLKNMIADLKTTNGISDDDIDIRAVVHSGGGYLLLKDGGLNGKGGTNSNQFQGQVEALMADGVKFYFCQNTTRGFIKNGTLPSGNATAQLIDGVEYVTAGVTAISDLQKQGYRYIQP